MHAVVGANHKKYVINSNVHRSEDNLLKSGRTKKDRNSFGCTYQENNNAISTALYICLYFLMPTLISLNNTFSIIIFQHDMLITP